MQDAYTYRRYVYIPMSHYVSIPATYRVEEHYNFVQTETGRKRQSLQIIKIHIHIFKLYIFIKSRVDIAMSIC